jgi:hypothetical protein
MWNSGREEGKYLSEIIPPNVFIILKSIVSHHCCHGEGAGFC